jgi:hypothetical protein
MASMAHMLLLWYVAQILSLNNPDGGRRSGAGEGEEDALGNLLTKAANSTRQQ